MPIDWYSRLMRKKVEGEIYEKMKLNIAGGPSIICNRYAKRNETKIRGGKISKKIIGYEANALYVWCLGNEMPCGRLTTIDPCEGIIKDIMNDKIFGFLKCDVEVPEHSAELQYHFEEMTPIFKNIDIEPERRIIGHHMYEFNESRGKAKSKGGRKLIGSYFGKQILVYTPWLKWYISHGLVITHSYSFIKAHSHRPFKSFMSIVSDARREGDVNKALDFLNAVKKTVSKWDLNSEDVDVTKYVSAFSRHEVPEEVIFSEAIKCGFELKTT
ncbi:hypothetical protein ON010_g7919 [Phytophthora cinnamomi]|nr:hypothetical protein ON010_g7919 [Phytophthora cinnamomi]